MNKPRIIEGGIACDDRGSLRFINDLKIDDIKRFYVITNNSTEIKRAFHGHMLEKKYLYIIKGSAKIICSKLYQDSDKVRMSGIKEDFSEFILDSRKNSILAIPPGYAHGFRFLKEDTILIVFSDKSLDESKGDDYRFDWDYLGKDVWEVLNR